MQAVRSCRRSCKKTTEQEAPEHLLSKCTALNWIRARHFGDYQLESLKEVGKLKTTAIRNVPQRFRVELKTTQLALANRGGQVLYLYLYLPTYEWNRAKMNLQFGFLL